MKKFLIGIVALLIVIGFFMFKSVGNSFSWSWFSSKIAAKETLKTDAYNVSMFGNDGRAYAFNFEDRQCLAVTTTEGVGLNCWERKQNN